MCFYVSTYMSMYHVHSRYLQSLEEDVVFPETGIADDCESLYPTHILEEQPNAPNH